MKGRGSVQTELRCHLLTYPSNEFEATCYEVHLRGLRFQSMKIDFVPVASVSTEGREGDAVPTTYVQLYVHLVWATWDRLPMLTRSIRETAYKCIRSECKTLGVKVIALGGTDDHVHLLVSLPTTICIADLVKQAKGSSAHLVNHQSESDRTFKWQGGYAAFTVSKSLGPAIRKYIQNQEEHHGDGTTDKDAEFPWVERDETPFE